MEISKANLQGKEHTSDDGAFDRLVFDMEALHPMWEVDFQVWLKGGGREEIAKAAIKRRRANTEGDFEKGAVFVQPRDGYSPETKEDLEETRVERSVETRIEVVEIVPDSNASKDGRVKVGDILRLTTAVFNVSAPIDVTTWMNPPAKANVRAYVKDSTFDKTMLAIQSHSVPVDYDGDAREMKSVGMVFERK
jgi:hypothetical protein